MIVSEELADGCNDVKHGFFRKNLFRLPYRRKKRRRIPDEDAISDVFTPAITSKRSRDKKRMRNSFRRWMSRVWGRKKKSFQRKDEVVDLSYSMKRIQERMSSSKRYVACLGRLDHV